MPTKDFWKLAEKRLGARKIADIKKEARQEAAMLMKIQNFIASSVEEYMAKNKVGFNELVDKLGSSPSHLAKIKKGQANLTIASFAHLMVTLEKEPEEVLNLTGTK